MSPEEIQQALDAQGEGHRMEIDDMALVVSWVDVIDASTLKVFPAGDDDDQPFFLEQVSKVSPDGAGLSIEKPGTFVCRIFPLGDVAPEVRARVARRADHLDEESPE